MLPLVVIVPDARGSVLLRLVISAPCRANLERKLSPNPVSLRTNKPSVFIVFEIVSTATSKLATTGTGRCMVVVFRPVWCGYAFFMLVGRESSPDAGRIVMSRCWAHCDAIVRINRSLRYL